MINKAGQKRTVDALIVGAGLSGAACAKRLVDAGYEVPVRLFVDQVGPPDRSAAAGLVLDNNLDAQVLFQQRLLPAGFQVGLAARIKRNLVGDRFGRIGFGRRRGIESQNSNHTENGNDEILHSVPPLLNGE